jgi:tRNA-specific 2-thiouridylase
MGADKIATGHYAKVQEVDGLFQLLKGDDGTKDQSYFLYKLNQSQLSRSIFPLGHLLKSDVRNIAKDNGLHNYDRKDSTGICFIGERPFAKFLSRYIKKNPGDIKNLNGNILGQHDGINFYTIGQRQGLKIGGTKFGNGAPWFVLDKKIKENEIIVGQGHEHPLLLKDGLTANDFHWILDKEPKTNWVYAAKTRYRQNDAPCEIDEINDEEFNMIFGQKQWAITPGQSVVIYESNVCLGGGIIKESINDE